MLYWLRLTAVWLSLAHLCIYVCILCIYLCIILCIYLCICRIYKTLYESEENSEYITNIIINDTLANKKTSIILIIGCETGIQANKLQLKEFDTYIIDKSVDMVNNALLSYPKLKTKVGNIIFFCNWVNWFCNVFKITNIKVRNNKLNSFEINKRIKFIFKRIS